MIRHWVQDVIEAAVASDGCDVADDLRRIVSIVRDSEQYMFRSPDLADLSEAMIEIESIDDLSRLLWDVAIAAGFQHATLFVLRQGSRGAFRQRICTSYPTSWINRFQERNYQFVDPIVAAAMSGQAPFSFSQAAGSGPVIDDFWKDANAHGIGRDGFCVPISTFDGSKIGVSFTFAPDVIEPKVRLARHRSDLTVIAHNAVEAFCFFARASYDGDSTLTSAELRYLHILMSSEDSATAGRPSHCSVTEAALQRSIIEKLQVRNIFHAVAVAAANKWFDDLPYDLSDVAHATAGRAEAS